MALPLQNDLPPNAPRHIAHPTRNAFVWRFCNQRVVILALIFILVCAAFAVGGVLTESDHVQLLFIVSPLAFFALGLSVWSALEVRTSLKAWDLMHTGFATYATLTACTRITNSKKVTRYRLEYTFQDARSHAHEGSFFGPPDLIPPVEYQDEGAQILIIVDPEDPTRCVLPGLYGVQFDRSRL